MALMKELDTVRATTECGNSERLEYGTGNLFFKLLMLLVF